MLPNKAYLFTFYTYYPSPYLTIREGSSEIYYQRRVLATELISKP